MKKQTQYLLFSLGLTTAAMTACSSGDPSSAVDSTRLDGGASSALFSMKLSSSALSSGNLKTALTSSGGSGLTITEAKLNVKEIKIKFPDGISCADAGFVASDTATCEEESEIEDGVTVVESKIKVSGPFIFDLVAGTSTPSLSTLQLPSGVYKKIELKVEESEGLSEHSMVVKGTYLNSSGAAQAFAMNLKISEEIKIENADGFNVIEGVENALTTTLNINQWLAGVDLAKCVDDGNLDIVDDAVLVNGDSGRNECENIDELIKDNIKDSMGCDNEEKDGKEGHDDEAESDDGELDNDNSEELDS